MIMGRRNLGVCDRCSFLRCRNRRRADCWNCNVYSMRLIQMMEVEWVGWLEGWIEKLSLMAG